MDIDEYFEQDEKYIHLDLAAYLESKYVVRNVNGYISAMAERFSKVRK